jgi:hypothetical protein
MIILNEIKEENNIAHSTFVTYPRTIQISHGVYDNTVDMMNMITMISQNISKNNELTNVYGGKTDWYFFNETPEFKRFMKYVFTKHRTSNFFFNDGMWYNKTQRYEAWGNELKKDDYVETHFHNCYHLILYLTEGNPLILPELNMKIIPKRGEYYVFPPYVLHGVEKLKKKDFKRYCLVANIHENNNWKLNKVLNDLKEKHDDGNKK